MADELGDQVKSVFSAKEMKALGVEPCAICKVLPGFFPTSLVCEGKPLHVFKCVKCKNSLGDFLEPSDQDEGVKHWNQSQIEMLHEKKHPFDKAFYESQIRPVLNVLAKEMEGHGRGLTYGGINNQASFRFKLDSLEKLGKEIIKTARELRSKHESHHKL